MFVILCLCVSLRASVLSCVKLLNNWLFERTSDSSKSWQFWAHNSLPLWIQQTGQCLIDLSRPCLHNVAVLKSHNLLQLVGKAAPHRLLFSADYSHCFTPIPFISNSHETETGCRLSHDNGLLTLCHSSFYTHTYSLAGISWILYMGSSISWGKHALSSLYPASILACSSQRADGVNLESFSFNLEVVEHNKKPSKQMHQRSYNYIHPSCLSSQSPQAIWVARQRQLDSYGFSQAGHLHRQTIENEKRGEQMMKNWEQRAWISCYMVALCSGSFDQHGGGNHCTSITRTSSSIIQQRRQELKAQLRAVWQIQCDRKGTPDG